MAPAQSRTGQRLDHRGLWHLKGQPDVLKNIQVEAQLNHQHLITHLIGKDRRTIFTPDRVSIESESGVLEESRDDPRSAYRGQSLESPWDDLHVAYFASYALWSYLTIPFLYTIPASCVKNSRLGKKMAKPKKSRRAPTFVQLFRRSGR